MPRAHDSEWQAELLRQTHGSRRTAARWLQQFPNLVNDFPAASVDFEALVRAEFELAARRSDDKSVDPNLCLDLARWFIRLKLEQLPESDLNPMIHQMAWLVDGNEPAAKEHLDWLAMLEQWQPIVDWSQAQGDRIEDWPEVQFRVAEALRRLGQDKAARLRGLQGREALPSGLEDCETIAHSLYALNYPVWAIEVLQHTLEQVDGGTEMNWRLRIDAAIWLEDQCRWFEAAETLEQGIRFADSRDDGWNSFSERESQATMRSEQLRLAALALRNGSPFDPMAIARVWTKPSH